MNGVIALFLVLGAGAFEQTFSQANTEYDSGRYEEAAQAYEQLIEQSVADPVVFYNLGNAYFRLGNLGYAIANYERALQLRPAFRAAQDNLQQALSQTKHKLNRPLPPGWEQSILFWHYGFSYRTTWIVAAACWFLFWLLLAVRRWRRLPYLRLSLFVVAMVAAAFGASAWIKAHPTPLAVAAGKTVPVRFGTTDVDKVHFELSEGDRVTITEERDGWIQVTTGGGERGWAQKNAFAVVGPPYSDLPMLDNEEEAAASEQGISTP
jgi:hypothetical protein